MNFSESILREMSSELLKAPKIYRPSKFWDSLKDNHIRELRDIGLENFKRTINRRYFNWGILGIMAQQMSPLMRMLRRFNFSPIFESKIENHRFDAKGIKKLNLFSATFYRIYVAALYDYVSEIDTKKVLAKLQEPRLGNPIIVKYKNKIISQDLCNSTHEFYSIMGKAEINDKKIAIAELGAGYGRVGYVFLKMLPQSSYSIIDIPPALYVAQEYLSAVFPEEKIFRFRPFKRFSDVKEEFESSRIRFMLPHQMELLPKKYFDIMMNINSLQEMDSRQISNFMNLFGRLCKGYFYMKQWQRSIVKDNSYISENEYPIPKTWKKIYSNQHSIQSMFFEALYKAK